MVNGTNKKEYKMRGKIAKKLRKLASKHYVTLKKSEQKNTSVKQIYKKLKDYYKKHSVRIKKESHEGRE